MGNPNRPRQRSFAEELGREALKTTAFWLPLLAVSCCALANLSTFLTGNATPAEIQSALILDGSLAAIGIGVFAAAKLIRKK